MKLIKYKNNIIKIKNLLGIRGTYKWAIKQMKEGAVINSESFNTNYTLLYDYRYNSIVVVNRYKENIKLYLFAYEFEHRLLLIDNFYITTTKRFLFNGNTILEWFSVPFKVYFNETSKIFKK